MSQREHAADAPVNAAFDQGCWRRRPRSSTAAAAAASSSFAPIARAPSSPRTGISLKWKLGAAGDRTIVRPAAAAPLRRPEQVEQHRAAEAKIRRARFFGYHPPTDKEHHPASRKCRRESTSEYQSTRLSIRGVGAVDPVA